MKITILPFHRKEKKTYHFGFTEDVSFDKLLELTSRFGYNIGEYGDDLSFSQSYTDDKLKHFNDSKDFFDQKFPNKKMVYKNQKNFISKQVVELDYDGGFSLANALSFFRNYKHIIGTTKSHRKEKEGKIEDRFRVILFFNKESKDLEEFNTIFRGLFTKLNIPKCDPRSGLPEQAWLPFESIISSNEYGIELDVEELISIAPVKKKATVIDSSDFKVLKNKKPLEKNTEEFLRNGISNLPKEKYFHQYFLMASIDLRKCGYSMEESIELLHQVPHTKEYLVCNFHGKYMATIEKVYSGQIKFYQKSKKLSDEFDEFYNS